MKHRIAAISLALLISSMGLAAQGVTVIPIPAPLLGANTVFVANGGGPSNDLSQAAYKSFYLALLNWKEYQLTDQPQKADLALDVSYGVGVTLYIRLDIRDTKTQSLLWSFTESLAPNPTPGDIDKATSNLIGDFKALITSTLVDAPPSGKTRFSQEGKK
jgi:hypothetical protein